MRWRYGMAVMLGSGLLVGAGCQPAQLGGAANRSARAAYLLAEEPAGSRGVLETKAALEAEAADKPAEVVMVGRIGGAKGFIWDPDRAAFTLVDATAGEGHGHGGDGCPFCREREKKALASPALIQLTDAQGEVPAVDARELLGLEEGQTIVVVGEGRIDGLGHVDIRARGVFIRP